MATCRLAGVVAVLLVILAATVGCSSRGQEKADVSASAIALRGVGATLPSPLYAKWFGRNRPPALRGHGPGYLG
jgi:ABC-type phosphate transport system substrate-binding protein